MSFKRPADEQEYSTEVFHNSQMDPTQNELNDLSQACNKLWELDYNRLTSYETVLGMNMGTRLNRFWNQIQKLSRTEIGSMFPSPYLPSRKSKDDLIDAIFPSLHINGGFSDYIISREILSTKNENVDEINNQLIDRFIGEQRVYYSFDETEDDKNNLYPMKFLNSLNVSGLPLTNYGLKSDVL
ncbi:hypothetical protein LXL04_009449 [Taraxacum kok-saghyz]